MAAKAPATNSQGYLEQVFQGLYGQAAPTIAQYQEQGALANEEVGLNTASEGVQAQSLASQIGYGEASLGNQLAGNQLSEQALGISEQTQAAQQGTEEQQYGVQSGQYGEQTQENQEQLANTQAQLGLEGQQTALNQQNLDYQLPQQVQAQAGASAAQGAGNTVGAKQAQGNIQEQYGQATAANQLATQGQSLQGTEAQESYGFGAQDIARNQQLAALGQQSEEQGYTGQQESNQNQGQQLQNTAAGIGISEGQLQSQLSSGLSQIGISGQQQQDSLLSQAATAQGGEAQAIGGVLSGVGAITGLGSSAFASEFPNLYGG